METHQRDYLWRGNRIQIDEPERPPHHRYRRNSDSAASPHRASSHMFFPRTRTFGEWATSLARSSRRRRGKQIPDSSEFDFWRRGCGGVDHGHLREITESPSPMDSPVTSGFPRRDLDFGRSRTIEFRDPSDHDIRFRRHRTQHPTDPDFPSTTQRRPSHANLQHHRDMGARTLTRTTTVDQQAMHTGFGGFPNPLVAAAALARQKIPLLRNAVERNLTINRTTTMLSTHSRGDSATGGVRREGTGLVKPVSYITFDAVVGRNSHFHGLTTAQQEELGGVEYRALSVLFKIVIAYWFLIQLLAVLLLAPYLTYVRRWNTVIVDAGTNATWFTFFQFISAYSNLGMRCVAPSSSSRNLAPRLTGVLCLPGEQSCRRVDGSVPRMLLPRYHTKSPHPRWQHCIPRFVSKASRVSTLRRTLTVHRFHTASAVSCTSLLDVTSQSAVETANKS